VRIFSAGKVVKVSIFEELSEVKFENEKNASAFFEFRKALTKLSLIEEPMALLPLRDRRGYQTLMKRRKALVDLRQSKMLRIFSSSRSDDLSDSDEPFRP
jgi:hypothetical protein